MEVARQKFVTLEAPGEQPILMKEIEPNPASEWRAGMNLMPGDLETKMLKLAQKELDAAGVGLSRNDDGTMCLVAAKHLHEGATICPLTSLIFDSEHALEHFLNHGWHRMLLAESHIIEVQGVLTTGGSKTSVYVVPIGIGKHLHHFAGIRKQGPNVQLVVDVGAGANDGFLAMQVRTRNRCGIAPGQPIVVNFGLEYDPDERAATKAELMADSPNSTKRKGILDHYFDQLAANAKVMKVEAMPPEEPGADDQDTKRESELEAKRKAELEAKRKADLEAKRAADKAGEEANLKRKADSEMGLASKAGKVGSSDVKDILVGEPTPGTLSWNGTTKKCTYTLPEGATANKKMPPKTILFTIQGKEGQLSPAQRGPKFALEDPKKSLVVNNSGSKIVTTLHDMIEKTKATSVDRHGSPFPEGVAPNALTGTNLHFQAADPLLASLVDFAMTSAHLQHAWILKTKEEGKLTKLTCQGLAVLMRKQVVIKAGEAFEFQ